MKRDAARPFIIAGHGIGGGLAILAAYEFTKRGRNVLAVVTFGAPQPGGAKFVAEYHRLGLDERTLNLIYAAGSPLMAQWPLLYRTAGTIWQLDRKPMTEPKSGREAAGTRNDGQGLATFALDALRKDEAPDAPMKRPLAPALASGDAVVSFEAARRHLPLMNRRAFMRFFSTSWPTSVCAS